MLDLRTNKECDVPALLASAVVQLCREKIVFRHHLCIFGNITVLVDDQPVVAFFSKDIHAPQKGTALAFLFTRGWYYEICPLTPEKLPLGGENSGIDLNIFRREQIWLRGFRI